MRWDLTEEKVLKPISWRYIWEEIDIHEAKRDYQESKVASQVVKWFDKQAFPMFIMRRKPFLKKFGFHFWIPVIQTYFK